MVGGWGVWTGNARPNTPDFSPELRNYYITYGR